MPTDDRISEALDFRNVYSRALYRATIEEIKTTEEKIYRGIYEYLPELLKDLTDALGTRLHNTMINTSWMNKIDKIQNMLSSIFKKKQQQVDMLKGFPMLEIKK